jgi:hypothetical protein
MCKQSTAFSRKLILAVIFCTTIFGTCNKQEAVSRANNTCDMNDAICCTCTATYISVGQIAETKSVCTPAEKQDFVTRWTNPLVKVECKR